MGLNAILIVVGTILVLVGAFVNPTRVSLAWLGTGLVFAGAFALPVLD